MKMIIKTPLQVICINTGKSKKLIKGGIYQATRQTIRNTIKYVSVNAGSFRSELFSLTDGSPLTSEPEFEIHRDNTNLNTSEKNYTGEYVRCRYGSGNLKTDEVYMVEQQRKIEKLRYNGQPYFEYKFKIRGIRNLINTYRFSELSTTEQRNFKLKKLQGIEIKTAEKTRKFLLYTEKEKIYNLYNVLTRTLLDMQKIDFNEKPDIIKLMLVRGKEYGMAEEDIIPFLKESSESLLKKFIK